MATRTALSIRKVTPAIGAVVEGVDLADVDADAAGAIRQALFDHGVLFFPGQQRASVDQLWEFLEHFGTPWKDDSFGSDEDGPQLVGDSDFQPTKSGTAVWHTDSSFLEKPTRFTLLRAMAMPDVGGDTCWASMTAAYEALHPSLREMLDGLSAVHTLEIPMACMGEYGDAFMAEHDRFHPRQQLHPMVAVHAETGRKALYVTESCTGRIEGVSPLESRHLLALLFEHIKSPDFNLRWRWSEGDVALWDNRKVQHYAVPDYDSPRVVQRIVVKGDRPLGPGS